MPGTPRIMRAGKAGGGMLWWKEAVGGGSGGAVAPKHTGEFTVKSERKKILSTQNVVSKMRRATPTNLLPDHRPQNQT